MNLKIADCREEWNDITHNSPHATLFHSWDWLKLMEKYTGSKLYPLIGLKGRVHVAAFPLFLQKKFMLKIVSSPPIPFTQTDVHYLGPLIVNYDKLKQSKRDSLYREFQGAVDKFISTIINTDYVNIATSPGLMDAGPFIWSDYEVKPMYTYLLDLQDGYERVWNQFNNMLRRNIKKTRERGVYIREGCRDDLGFICSSLTARHNNQHTKEQQDKLGYLKELYDLFYPDNLRVFIAEGEGKMLTGLIILACQKKVSSWIGTSKTDEVGVYPNDLLLHETIKWAADNNFYVYELLGADTLSLRQFKSKFNPRLEMYLSARKYLSKKAFVMENMHRKCGTI